MNNNPPGEPGIYWARSFKCEWWNLIVEIAGDVPYLRIEWVYDRKEAKITADGMIQDFGTKIEPPPDPKLSSGERW